MQYLYTSPFKLFISSRSLYSAFHHPTCVLSFHFTLLILPCIYYNAIFYNDFKAKKTMKSLILRCTKLSKSVFIFVNHASKVFHSVFLFSFPACNLLINPSNIVISSWTFHKHPYLISNAGGLSEVSPAC